MISISVVRVFPIQSIFPPKPCSGFLSTHRMKSNTINAQHPKCEITSPLLWYGDTIPTNDTEESRLRLSTTS